MTASSLCWAGGSHALHGDDRSAWPVSNCYTDMWIELLRWLGHDPIPGLAFCLAADWEGDQWSLHKYPPLDLYLLYGLDVAEINVWKPLREHVTHHVRAGRPVLLEVDGYHLPDTASTTYHRRHEKTTIAVVDLDPDAGTARYFHDGSGYELVGADFAGAICEGATDGGLPPYVEVVRRTRREALEGAALVEAGLGLGRLHLGRRPVDNPFLGFADAIGTDLAAVAKRDRTTFHQYAFTSIRQPGSAFQYAAEFLRWLDRGAELGLGSAAAHLDHISGELKTLMLKAARVTAGRPASSLEQGIDQMAECWELAMDDLLVRLGGECARPLW